MTKEWFSKWFNEDYVNLYSCHNHKEAERHVDFLLKITHKYRVKRVLDVGCGSGRHSILLAERGFEVVGVDISKFLMAQAKELENIRLKFLNRDILHLDGIGRFDLAINMFTSFGYFDCDNKNGEIVAAIGRNLKKGALFFMDYLHPNQVIRDLVPYEIKMINGERVEIFKEIRGREVRKKIVFPGRSYEERVKLYDRQTIERMFIKGGFKVIGVYNDYCGNPWRERGDRQLFLALFSPQR